MSSLKSDSLITSSEQNFLIWHFFSLGCCSYTGEYGGMQIIFEITIILVWHYEHQLLITLHNPFRFPSEPKCQTQGHSGLENKTVAITVQMTLVSYMPDCISLRVMSYTEVSSPPGPSVTITWNIKTFCFICELRSYKQRLIFVTILRNELQKGYYFSYSSPSHN